jgi:hypothetical protein
MMRVEMASSVASQEGLQAIMRISNRREFANRPSLEREDDWCASQLRIIFRLIQSELQLNPLLLSNPQHYLTQLNRDIGLIPGMGMYAFWLIAIRAQMGEETVMDILCRMYTDCHKGYTFRQVAFPSYKANRRTPPRAR